MIRAVPIETDFVRNELRFAFELTRDTGPTLLYARWPEGYDGWVERRDLADYEPGTRMGTPVDESVPGPRLVIVELPRDVAAALAEGILTVTDGIPATDMRAMRRDLEHERGRRDKLEEAITTIALSTILAPAETIELRS